VLDLISELKSLREENTILLNNNLILEKDNLNLKREMADLEMDTQITLQAIKTSHYGNIDSTNPTPVNNYQNTNQATNNMIADNLSNDNFNSLRKKYDQLSLDYATLLSKEKAIKENVSKLTLETEIAKNLAEGLKIDLAVSKERITSQLNEIASLEKTAKFLNENMVNLQKEVNSLKLENDHLNKIKKEFEEFKTNNKDGTKSSKEYLELKINYDKIEKLNKTLAHEKDQLLNLKNVLQSQKDILSKEYEKVMKERVEFEINQNKNISIDLDKYVSLEKH
jgi:hypothetical protein